MKATITTTGHAQTITGRTNQEIKKKLNAMLKIGGPRGLTAITETGTTIHVELYEGQDYIKPKSRK